MTDLRSALLCAATGLLFLPGPVLGYEADEARAIVVGKPAKLPPHVQRVILASQRQLSLQGPGELECIDHILWMVGPAGPRDQGRMRWTHRIGIESVRMMEGWVHRAGGRREPIPPDSAKTEPCLEAGKMGYPGIADMVITPPPLAPGDVVEVKVQGGIAPVFLVKHYIGEHHFGGPDSTIESEFRFTFPNDLPLRTWWFGNVPAPEETMLGGSTMARWFLGHLPPEPPSERTISAYVTPCAPESIGPPVLRYGFPDDWESIVQSRRRLWRLVLQKMPDSLVTVSGAIKNEHPDPEGRLDAAIAWEQEHLAPIDIPATRMWFEPSDLAEIVARGAAIPRDRAAVLVWLLRNVGIAAEAAMVGGRSPLIEEVPLPQQLDTWIVLARPRAGVERWIDLRSDEATGEIIPPGKALLWTSLQGDPILIPFPGIKPRAGN